jgi:hypothetical protein
MVHVNLIVGATAERNISNSAGKNVSVLEKGMGVVCGQEL